MKVEIGNTSGSITLCEVPEKDHLGRVHLEIRIGDKYIYQGLEEVTKTIEALEVKKREMEMKLRIE